MARTRYIWMVACCLHAALLLGACGADASSQELMLGTMSQADAAPAVAEAPVVLAAKSAAVMPPQQTQGQGGPDLPAQAEAATTLAYAHSVAVEVAQDKVISSQKALIDSCASRKDCTLLQAAQYGNGRHSRTQIELRASAASVAELMEMAQAQGRVKNTRTEAEDLALPLRDGARRLTMLQDYRQQLEALGRNRTQSVGDLIEITRELATVQSQIEDLAGTRAHLLQRVQTQRLEVVFEAAGWDDAAPSGWSRLQQAVRNFTDNLLAGLAWGIEALGWLLPVLLLGVLLVAAVHRIWRIWQTWRSKRQRGQHGQRDRDRVTP